MLSLNCKSRLSTRSLNSLKSSSPLRSLSKSFMISFARDSRYSGFAIKASFISSMSTFFFFFSPIEAAPSLLNTNFEIVALEYQTYLAYLLKFRLNREFSSHSKYLLAKSFHPNHLIINCKTD